MAAAATRAARGVQAAGEDVRGGTRRRGDAGHARGDASIARPPQRRKRRAEHPWRRAADEEAPPKSILPSAADTDDADAGVRVPGALDDPDLRARIDALREEFVVAEAGARAPVRSRGTNRPMAAAAVETAMARTSRVETERANALDAKVETTLSSMAERAERAAAAAERAEKAVDRAPRDSSRGERRRRSRRRRSPRRRRRPRPRYRRPPRRRRRRRRRRGRVPADARGETRVEAGEAPPPPPPLPVHASSAEVDGTAGATAEVRRGEARGGSSR